MKFINRILIIIFALLLIRSSFDREYLGVTALFAIPLGFVQLLYCISLGLRWGTLKFKSKCFIGSYLIAVVTYFILCVKFSNTNFDNLFITLFFFGFPIVLAFGVTAFLELKKFDN